MSSSHAVLTKCRACDNQAATRIAALPWGCHCTRVTRTGGTGTRKEDGAKRGAKNLFVDSDKPGLAWWNHEANSESELKTVTVKATREAVTICFKKSGSSRLPQAGGSQPCATTHVVLLVPTVLTQGVIVRSRALVVRWNLLPAQAIAVIVMDVRIAWVDGVVRADEHEASCCWTRNLRADIRLNVTCDIFRFPFGEEAHLPEAQEPLPDRA